MARALLPVLLGAAAISCNNTIIIGVWRSEQRRLGSRVHGVGEVLDWRKHKVGRVSQ